MKTPSKWTSWCKSCKGWDCNFVWLALVPAATGLYIDTFFWLLSQCLIIVISANFRIEPRIAWGFKAFAWLAQQILSTVWYKWAHLDKRLIKIEVSTMLWKISRISCKFSANTLPAGNMMHLIFSVGIDLPRLLSVIGEYLSLLPNPILGIVMVKCPRKYQNTVLFSWTYLRGDWWRFRRM